MDNSKQIATVKKALDLSVLIADTKNKLLRLQEEKPPQKPACPTRAVVQKAEILIVPKKKFNLVLAVVLFLVFMPLCIIYYFVYKYQRKTEIERIANSDEYKKQCIAVEEEYQRKQADADAIFKRQSEEYETVILPKYQKDLEEWPARHNQQIIETEERLQQARNALQELYDATKIVPVQYRNVNALQYIYDVMSTSNYDIVQAISNYDQKVRRDLERERLIQQRRAAERQAQLLEEEEYYSQQQSSSEHSFLSNVASTAIGTYGLKKEMRKQTQFMEEQAKRAERADREQRRRAAQESQRRRAAIIRENQERRRKGLPPLPVPPADWY